MIEKKIEKLLLQLAVKDETINDTIQRLINAYIYPYNPTHGFPFTPYHVDSEKSLTHQINKRGGIGHERESFRSEKSYQLWLKQLKQIPKHLKGEI